MSPKISLAGVRQEPLDVPVENLLSFVLGQESVLDTSNHRRGLIDCEIRTIEDSAGADLFDRTLENADALYPRPRQIDVRIFMLGHDRNAGKNVVAISAEVREDD